MAIGLPLRKLQQTIGAQRLAFSESIGLLMTCQRIVKQHLVP